MCLISKVLKNEMNYVQIFGKVSIKPRTTTVLSLNKSPRDFPGSAVVKIPCFQCRRAWVQSLVQELRSYMLHDTAKKLKKKKKKEIKLDY